MQKILVINGHPNPEASVAGNAVLNALESFRCEMQIRTLAQLCGPNGFDVTAEQEALRRADVIVWHFPFYWYSVPAILKKWIDDVLTRGFAHIIIVFLQRFLQLRSWQRRRRNSFTRQKASFVVYDRCGGSGVCKGTCNELAGGGIPSAAFADCLLVRHEDIGSRVVKRHDFYSRCSH